MFMLKVHHHKGTLVSFIVSTLSSAESALTQLKNSNPAAYTRLGEYKQCRYEVMGSNYFWALLPQFDWDYIKTLVSKELESYG